MPARAIVTDGAVYASAVSGSKVYLGGSFSAAGPQTGPLAAVNPASGAVAAGAMPVVAGGTVAALVPDGAGGWYVGGDFTGIGGIPASGLAHVLATGAVDTGFDVWLDGPVKALALSGGRLYVGGGFQQANGAGVHYLVAVDPASGVLLGFRPDLQPDLDDELLGIRSSVDALAVAGDTVYAGGRFTHDLVALRASDGAVEPWAGGIVRSLVELSFVGALAVSGDTLYVGGSFAGVPGNRDARNLAALDLATGAARAWAPQPISTHEGGGDAVAALAPGGGRMAVGGAFGGLGLSPRHNLAAMDLTTGALLPWAPATDGIVSALALGGGHVFAGGAFLQPQAHLAAFDPATGALQDWSPGAFAYELGDIVIEPLVDALQVVGDRLYVGGAFNSIGGHAVHHLVRLAVADAALDPWTPAFDALVTDVAVDGATAYAAGTFTHVADQARNNVAAVRVSDASPTPFDPQTGEVLAIAPAGGTVYLGGAFTSVHGAVRHKLAAVRAADGSVLPWDPDVAPLPGGDDVIHATVVDALAVTGSTVYAGGVFQRIGARDLSRLAALDATTGAPLDWTPDPGPYFAYTLYFVARLEPLPDGRLLAGGDFSTARYGAASGVAVFGATPAAQPRGRPDAGVNSVLGTALTCRPPGFLGAAAPVSVQWLRDRVPFAGGATHVLGEADVGHEVSCRASAGGPAADSRPLIVLPQVPYAQTLPALSGEARVGRTLTCSPGTWLMATRPLRFSWLRFDPRTGGHTTIPGATAATYVVQPADAGFGLGCEVTATNPFGSTSRGTGALGVAPTYPPTLGAAPAISGSPVVGGALACTEGRWYGALPFAYAYQWLRDGAPIPGQAAATYRVAGTDAGHALSCRVTASNGDGAATADSPAVQVARGGIPPARPRPRLRLAPAGHASLGGWCAGGCGCGSERRAAGG